MSRPSPTVALATIDQLDAATLAAWRRARSTDPALASPFYDPAFTAAVSAAGPDRPVRVIVIGDIAFWPVAFLADGTTGPVGGPLNDNHGMIGRVPSSQSSAAILRSVGIRAHRFDHLPITQSAIIASARSAATASSPFLDLRDGFEPYATALAGRGSKLPSAMRNARRRLERDLGPLRFTWDDRDPASYSALVGWKSSQYRATGAPDRFQPGSTASAIERLRRLAEPGCTGVVSTLRAGERLVSAHLGLRSETELHWWLPAYDAAIGAQYSVGLQLLWSVAEVAPAHGIGRIDLGKGVEPYKQRAATGAVGMAAGVVEPASLSVAARRARSLGRKVGRRLRP